MVADLSKVTSYVYIRSEPGLWTVGFYRPDGKWEPESDWDSTDKAAARAAFLMGGESPNSYDRLKRVEKVGLRLADYIDTLGAVAGVPDLRTWKLVLAKARELQAEIGKE